MNPWLEIFIIFILPILLWYFGLVSIKYRFRVFVLMNIATVMIVWKEHWSLRQFGLRIDNFYASTVPYILFTIIGFLFLFFLAKLHKRDIVDERKTSNHFIYWFIILSFSQEFLYRAFLMPRLLGLFSPVLAIIVNTFLFGILHIIYPELKKNLFIIVLAGFAFATVYYYYPNLILISISHSILNYVAVMYGYFSFYKIKQTI